jgi:hypothetical protein
MTFKIKLPEPDKAYGEPSSVAAIEGEVVMMGPDGVGVSMTPEAAEETADRLKAGAAEAKRQQAGRTPRTRS